MRAEGLRAHVERRGDAAVVCLSGVLGVDTSPVLRSAVLACLAAEPSVIVLEVAGLRLHDDVALTVLPALARHAAAWPGIAMVLAAVPAPLAAALDRMAVTHSMRAFPTIDAALAMPHDGRGPADRQATVSLPPLLDATAAARHLVARACGRWGFENVRDVAELVVTELVSNVLRHAGTKMDVKATRDHRCLHISVRDRGAGMPHLGGHPADEILSEDGRGLLVVSALTRAWGCIPVPDGKVVWATVGQ
ncbi:ATP-binding protein [Dactylosporangium vinaceum]|uniref:ATP-binding protein n=1 Tax=Dactylosporangium vinaceum TaxID=53362 RepID=A0ABV5M5H0_9ACTN|nr:ATP-binding protein [Dactylosporangium vinaceum]UAB95534.1 ATP-binding protein [Dactylosporangium vinaceum]